MEFAKKKVIPIKIEEDEEKEVPEVELKGFIYSWGKNKDGELSVGGHKNQFFPAPIKGLKDKKLQFLESGDQHSAAIGSDGKVYVSGSSLHGKLGIEDLGLTHINTFHAVPMLKNEKVK
mmetsp:Transcript_32468/g.29293  ORF Transcript_32468/g.29293 Transcript_32468/m.29293 type:complete len:119 (+) Transcript_32468:38-394(+)